MNIKTDGSHEHRLDLMRRVMQRTGENTKAGAIDRSLEATSRLLDALERAAKHEDMTPELTEVLSTPQVTLRYELNMGVGLK